MERRKFFLDAVAGLDIIKPAILAPAVRLVINRRIKERNMSVRKVCVAMVLVVAAVTAAYGEPLVEVLPEDALFLAYVPDLGKAITAINDFTPGPQADIPFTAEMLAAQAGLPADAFAGPVAFAAVASPEDMGGDEPPPPLPILILQLNADAVAALKQGAKADADGICELELNDVFSMMMEYRGYVAFSDEQKALKMLAAKDLKTWKAEGAAAELVKEGQAFFHVNLPGILNACDSAIEKGLEKLKADMEADMEGKDIPLAAGAPDMMVAMLKGIVDVAKEVTSIDASYTFSAGGWDTKCAATIAPGGKLSRYMVGSGGVKVLQPALPAMDKFVMSAWIRCDQKVIDAIVEDYTSAATEILGKLLKDDAELDKLKAAITGMLNDAKGLVGERMSLVFAMPEGQMRMAEVFEVQKPDEFKARLKRMTESYNTMMTSFLGKDAGVGVQYEYTADAETIAGEKVDRIHVQMNAGDEEADAALAQAMAMYGPDGLNYYITVVGKLALVSMSPDDMAQLIVAVKGGGDADLLSDDPDVRSMARKIGLSNDMIFMVVPARMIESSMQMVAKMMGQQNNAMPLPFATPAVAGVRVADATTIRLHMHVPQSVVSECMTVVMSMMMGGGMGPLP